MSCVFLVPLWAYPPCGKWGGVPLLFEYTVFSTWFFSPSAHLYHNCYVHTAHAPQCHFIHHMCTLSLPNVGILHISSLSHSYVCISATHLHTYTPASSSVIHFPIRSSSPLPVCLCAPCASMAHTTCRFRHALAVSKPPPPAHPGTVCILSPGPSPAQ